MQNLAVSDHSAFKKTFTKISLGLLLLNCILRQASTPKIREKKGIKTLSEKPCISSGPVLKLHGAMKFARYRGIKEFFEPWSRFALKFSQTIAKLSTDVK